MRRTGTEIVIEDPLSADRLRRARTGDGPAFAELLAPILDPAFRLAMTMLKDRSAAEDAVLPAMRLCQTAAAQLAELVR